MFLLEIFNLENMLPRELIQTLELIIIFISLYGIIIYLFMTAKNKKYFQRQK